MRVGEMTVVGRRPFAAWLDVMLAVLAAAAVIGVLRVAFTLDLPLAYGTEGWNAYHALEAASGANPYPPPGGLFYNNYPPLSFYLVGGLGRLFGDAVVAGRAVSLLSFIVIAFGVFRSVLTLGCDRREAAFAALLFSCLLLFDYTYVGMNDPQMLGHAVQVWGLVLILREPRTAASMFGAALLFTAAFFVKHSLVALPLAATAWLIATDRRHGLLLAGFGLLLLALGLMVFEAVFGVSLSSQLDNPRVWVLDYSLNALGARIPEGLVPLAASLALLWTFRRDRQVAFCAVYLIVSLLAAACFLGGAGVGSKALYDVVIALALCAGLGLNRLAAAGRARPLYAACHFVPVLGVLLYHPLAGTLPPHWTPRDAPAVADTPGDVAFLKAHAGLVLCTKLTLCFWAGKPAGIDLWGYEEAVTLGARDGHELKDAIAARHFAVLQLWGPPRLPGAYPNVLGAPPEVDRAYVAAVIRLVEANYRVARRSANGAFWVPRD